MTGSIANNEPMPLDTVPESDINREDVVKDLQAQARNNIRHGAHDKPSDEEPRELSVDEETRGVAPSRAEAGKNRVERLRADLVEARRIALENAQQPDEHSSVERPVSPAPPLPPRQYPDGTEPF